MNHCVITTVNHPTKAIESLYKIFGENLIIVGDKKTPPDWNYKELSVLMECDRPYAPNNHYARKNIGYLTAIKNKASLIYDTDDDNIPMDNWKIRDEKINVKSINVNGWFNTYEYLLSRESAIWPRGFSLKQITGVVEGIECHRIATSSIQQGLADGDADVDAIWRLTNYHSPILFDRTNQSLFLEKNTWCPFNSQSTWWFPKAYPLMYLPVTASFRMTDIWRSFIAQKCLWSLGEGVTFHSPSEVFQDRNEHDLMKDFADEVPGYLHNDEIVEILSNLNLKSGEDYICENLLTCYQALVDKKILPYLEIESVMAWIKDYGNATGTLR